MERKGLIGIAIIILILMVILVITENAIRGIKNFVKEREEDLIQRKIYRNIYCHDFIRISSYSYSHTLTQTKLYMKEITKSTDHFGRSFDTEQI